MSSAAATAAPPTLPISRRAERLKPSATLAAAAKVKALQAAGRIVHDFTTGEPDFDTPAFIKDAAIAALKAGMTKYQPVPGPLDARQAIAAKLGAENGISCTPDQIVITSGGKSAVYLALQALVDEGDEVIIPTPAWVSYRPMVELCGGRAVEVPGAIRSEFKISPAQLAAAVTPRTRAVIFNSPSNPCGTMYAPDELRALGRVLEPHARIAILSDEIYEKLIFGNDAHFSIGSMPSLAARTITINGLSKAYAMTGWRLGYLAAPQVVAQAIIRLQGQMTSHVTSFTGPAIVEALRRGAESIEAMRRVFARRAERVHAILSGVPGIICPRATGAFYVFPDIGATFGRRSPGGREIRNSFSFADALLEEASVAVVPGDEFGAGAERHVRLSFACADERIEAGYSALASFVRGVMAG